MWFQSLELHIDQIHPRDLNISQKETHVGLTAVIMKRCLRVQK